MHRIAAVVAGLSLAFVGTSATIAATINVPADQPTIAAAISASADGDVINIAAGTYFESSLNPDGKAITIQGTLNGDGSLATTINAFNELSSGPAFDVDSGEGNGTVIQNLVIRGGANSVGGGISCTSSSPIIRGCMITDNAGLYEGGGIYCYDASPIIENCTITDNRTSAVGGGGIACSTDSNPTITGCTITFNTSQDGGGIYCSNSSPTISDCTISGNSATLRGGGIYGINSVPTISLTRVCENTPNQIASSRIESFSCIASSCDTCDEDSDGEGVLDYLDNCPDVANADQADLDGDDVGDACDNCPDDPLKTEPGDCGCGELETDTDSDGTPDCIDGCPNDSDKTEPGNCGCGVAETTVFGDVDCDGDYDIDDAYAAMVNFGIDNGPTGACCVSSGCHAVTEIACTGMGGTWLGADATCDDCAPTCQGDANADGTVDVFDLLKVIDGWGLCD